MSRRDRYPEKKGRGRSSGRFTMLRHRLLNSAAYRSLSPNARSLLIELAMIENGQNNGELYLSVRDAAARMGVADTKAASRAFEELKELGFIAVTKDAHFAVKTGEGSRARAWRLTWQAVAGKQGPTNEFEHAEPKPGKLAARKRMERGLRALKRWRREACEEKFAVEDSTTPFIESVGDSPTPPHAGTIFVADSTTRFGKNGAIPRSTLVEDSTTHSELPSGQRSAGDNRADGQIRLDALRWCLINHLKTAPYGEQGRLAKRARISDSQLSLFKHQGAPLTDEKRLRLAEAINVAAALRAKPEPELPTIFRQGAFT